MSGQRFRRVAAVTAAASMSCALITWSSAAPAASSSSSASSGQLAASVQPLGMAGTWNVVFDDEFNGPGLDTTKWSTGWFGSGITAGVNSAEDDCYDPAQVSVSGGSLGLTAIRKTELCGSVQASPQVQNTPSAEDYATGAVTTFGKAQFSYGAFEARIDLPVSGNRAVANWPAWWADGRDWPADGEMDIMEGLGGQACFHFHSLAGAPGGCAGYDFAGWHVYGADWEPGSVTYYYDGVEVGRITTGVTSAPMFLILDNAVAGAGGITVTPGTMKVDYVRVWAH